MAVDGYPVVWTQEAIINKDAIHQYLKNNWSAKAVRKFFQKLEERIKLISFYPKLFQRIGDRDNIYRSVLTHQITLYYRFETHRVEILYLFDTRQNPDNLNFDV